MANRQKVRSPARAWILLSGGLIGIVLGTAAALGIGFALLKLQTYFCGPDAFLSGPTQVGELVLLVPWFIIVVPLGFPLVMQADILARRMLGMAAKPPQRKITRRRSARERRVIPIIASLFIVLALASLAALPSYFCATANGVTWRKAVWTEPKTYGWDDVLEVVAECYKSGRSGRNSYELAMTDGNRIDLAVRNGEFAEAYPQVRQALHGGAFPFAAKTPENCPAHLKAIFSTRP